MERTFDAASANAVCASTGMPIWCGTPDRPIDLSPVVQDRRNYFFVGAGGFFGAVWRGAGLYEVHLAFGLMARGLGAIRALRGPIHFMLSGPADTLFAAIPESNRACRWLALRFGFVRISGELGAWHDEALFPYAISRMMWFRSDQCHQPS